MKINTNGMTVKTENVTTRSEKPSNKTTSANSNNATRLTLSENTRNPTGELTQSLINTQNNISLLQTADEAYSKIHSILQQGKELTIQASTTQDVAEKQAFQNQITALNRKIDHLSNSVQNYTPPPIEAQMASNQDNKDLIYALKSTWLKEGEELIQQRYGLTGDGANLRVVLDQGREPYLAAIYYNYDETGKATNQTMHIAVQTALPASLPNGGSNPGQYDDRVITHEMVHVLMGRTMKVDELPNWFQEGTAEFIHGPNERVFHDLNRKGGGIQGAAEVQNALGDGTNNTWVNNSVHYSAASMAVRYLHEKIKADGHSGGIRDLLTDLKEHPTENLDQALSRVSPYGNTDEFVGDFVLNGNGAAFIHKLDVRGEFTNAILGGDTGAIGGEAADNGPVQNAESVIPDRIHTTNTPLKNFNIIWPDLEQNQSRITFKHNPRGTTLDSTLLKVDSNVLNTNHVDLVNNPNGGTTLFAKAITHVSNKQAEIKQIQNALQNQAAQINETVSNSNIQDPSTMKETFEVVKRDLSNQDSTVISTLAKPQPERVLQLLKTN